MGHLSTKSCCQGDLCSSVIQFDHINLDHSILFCFTYVLNGENLSYIGMRIVHLCLCHVIQTILAFQHTNDDYVGVQLAGLMM